MRFKQDMQQHKEKRLGSHSFDHVIGYQRLDELQDQLQNFSLDIEKKTALILPEKVYTKRYVDLSDEQLKAYVQMKQRAIMEIEGTTFSSVNASDQLMRLQQVVAGSLRDDDGSGNTSENNRLQAVLIYWKRRMVRL